MANLNSRCALVNRSGTSFPVYEKLVQSGAFTGGITAGGSKIGEIMVNEFYTVVPNDSPYITSYRIIFQNPQGKQAVGYIETTTGYSAGVDTDYAWAKYQEPYHYYNSNGSTLVASTKETIGGKSYRIFTIYGSARSYRNPTGTLLGTLPVGTKLATNESSTGQTYGGYMVFNKKKLPNGSWQDLTSSGYGFVDLGLNVGSFPSNRPIR